MSGRDSPRPQAVPPEGREQEAPGLRAVGTADAKAAAPGGDKRSLSDAEVRLLREVFGDGLDYKPMRLVRMAPFIAGLNGSRAFVLGNTLHLPSIDYDALWRGDRAKAWLLVHESTHVWQYQHRGIGYVAESLWAQSFGEGYDYVKALRAGKPWTKMNPEQQAQLIQDTFHGGYFEAPGVRFGAVGGKGAVLLPGGKTPEGFTDYTPVLVAALDVLRKPA
ncbi:MAG TPA: hypothetical protein VFZ09_00370 [Archangium sp.]|uniref:hypothetical protein n=1 Tax=Archangium sp. TaxID=1872627 RepID=UPI002E3576ED|nr:hypothetical protein [Archangium sp.]HEX5744659.1 hypothetical protein [Archangium sp.]